MKKRLIGVILIGAGLMAASAYGGSKYAKHHVINSNDGTWVTVDGWRTNTDIGGASADAFLRARIAYYGLLALSSEETVYFGRSEDNEGRPFTDACTYIVSGRDLDARWWSLTAYDGDQFLIDNGDDVWSIDQSRVSRDPDGQFEIQISPQQNGAQNWISSKDGGEFSLVMRLYNPGPDVVQNPGKTKLPRVERIACETSETTS